MKTIMQGIIAVAAFLTLLAAPSDGHAQSLSTEQDCNAIGGTWQLVRTPPLFAQCSLSQYYEAAWYNPLSISPGIRLSIEPNGRLINQDTLVVNNTAELVVNGGRFSNFATVETTNRGVIRFNGGQMINSGLFSMEGDVFINDTPRNPNTALPDCVSNRGVMRFWSGGNLLLQGGCIDSQGHQGDLRIDVTGTMIAEGPALYRGGRSDTIAGTLIVEAGASAEFPDLRLSGIATIEGRVYASRNRLQPSSESGFRVEDGGQISVLNSGRLTVNTNTADIYGSVRLEDRAILETDGTSTMTVHRGGYIYLDDRSSGMLSLTTVENRGLIEHVCKATFKARWVNGNRVRYYLCPPTLPLRPPFPLPIRWP
ncbi:MAG: hypothetical protein AAFV47_02525 [Pseudomonadota bacterium]